MGYSFPEHSVCIQLPLDSIQSNQSKNKNDNFLQRGLHGLFRPEDIHTEHPGANRRNGLFKNHWSLFSAI